MQQQPVDKEIAFFFKKKKPLPSFNERKFFCYEIGKRVSAFCMHEMLNTWVWGWEASLINCGKRFKEYGQGWWLWGGGAGGLRAFSIFRIETQDNSIYGTEREGNLVTLRKGIFLVKKSKERGWRAVCAVFRRQVCSVETLSLWQFAWVLLRAVALLLIGRPYFIRVHKCFRSHREVLESKSSALFLGALPGLQKKRSLASSHLSVCPSACNTRQIFVKFYILKLFFSKLHR